MGRRKEFAEGQAIEFVRDTEFRRPWEQGIYVRACGDDFKGWHRVKARDGFGTLFTVPSRRLRTSSADWLEETPRGDPQVTPLQRAEALTDTLSRIMMEMAGDDYVPFDTDRLEEIMTHYAAQAIEEAEREARDGALEEAARALEAESGRFAWECAETAAETARSLKTKRKEPG